MSNGSAAPGIVDRLMGFALERGNKWTFAFMGIGLTAKIGLSILHRSLDEGLTTLYFVGITGAIGTLVLRGKRTTDMVATGIGEMKAESPNLRSGSQDPAIDRVIDKVKEEQRATGEVHR